MSPLCPFFSCHRVEPKWRCGALSNILCSSLNYHRDMCNASDVHNLFGRAMDRRFLSTRTASPCCAKESLKSREACRNKSGGGFHVHNAQGGRRGQSSPDRVAHLKTRAVRTFRFLSDKMLRGDDEAINKHSISSSTSYFLFLGNP
jgi:hypothetical protein